MIDKKRLAEVRKRGLDEGAHRSVADGMCAMEAFSYIRRIPFTDHPPCVSPVIAGFMRSWNDALPDAERNILIPLLPKLIDTVNPKLEQRRSLMAADSSPHPRTTHISRYSWASTRYGLSGASCGKVSPSKNYPISVLTRLSD